MKSYKQENQDKVLMSINDLTRNVTYEVQSVVSSCVCHDNKQRRRVRKAVDDILSNLDFENLPEECKDVRTDEGRSRRVVLTHKLFQEKGLCSLCSTHHLLARTSGLKIFSDM